MFEGVRGIEVGSKAFSFKCYLLRAYIWDHCDFVAYWKTFFVFFLLTFQFSLLLVTLEIKSGGKFRNVLAREELQIKCRTFDFCELSQLYCACWPRDRSYVTKAHKMSRSTIINMWVWNWKQMDFKLRTWQRDDKFSITVSGGKPPNKLE